MSTGARFCCSRRRAMNEWTLDFPSLLFSPLDTLTLLASIGAASEKSSNPLNFEWLHPDQFICVRHPCCCSQLPCTHLDKVPPAISCHEIIHEVAPLPVCSSWSFWVVSTIWDGGSLDYYGWASVSFPPRWIILKKLQCFGINLGSRSIQMMQTSSKPLRSCPELSASPDSWQWLRAMQRWCKWMVQKLWHPEAAVGALVTIPICLHFIAPHSDDNIFTTCDFFTFFSVN